MEIVKDFKAANKILQIINDNTELTDEDMQTIKQLLQNYADSITSIIGNMKDEDAQSFESESIINLYNKK